MCAGYLSQMLPSSFGVFSAGVKGKKEIKPEAVKVMAEDKVDISSATVNHVSEFDPNNFEVVVRCCGCDLEVGGNAGWNERPTYRDWNVDGSVTRAGSSLEEFQSLRDEIKKKCQSLADELLLSTFSVKSC